VIDEIRDERDSRFNDVIAVHWGACLRPCPRGASRAPLRLDVDGS
jgi:hypothetical protein